MSENSTSKVTVSSLVTRNVRIHDRRTSVRLEPQLWRALETISRLERTDMNTLCSKVADERPPVGGFTSALRVYIIEYFGAGIIDQDKEQPKGVADARRTARLGAPTPIADQARGVAPRFDRKVRPQAS